MNDRAAAGIRAEAGAGGSAAAALVVLASAPGLSVTALSQRVGLSQPAAARMLDTLQRDGSIVRERGVGREVSVVPTRAGTQRAVRLLAARGRALDDLLAVLDPDERSSLAELLAKLLTRAYLADGSAELLCRLCDRTACVAGQGCPVGQAERAQQE